jgi:hypothetical protein
MQHKITPLVDRFWKYVDKSGDCWLWTGAKTFGGYGVIHDSGRKGKIVRAHRLSWELHNGPFPAELDVCHKCDNPACVRPDHLFLGSAKDNVADMVHKGRASGGSPRGSLHHQAKLTEAQVLDIRAAHAAGAASQRQLAREYGVDRKAIQQVIRRKTWIHV